MTRIASAFAFAAVLFVLAWPVQSQTTAPAVAVTQAPSGGTASDTDAKADDSAKREARRERHQHRRTVNHRRLRKH
ncbi:MAG: hypothetical protein ACM3X5_01390 [Bacillota bacterium]